MKSLLFLSLIGAAIYAALLIANPPDPHSDTIAVQAQAGATAGQRSSWASDLSSLKPQIAAQDRPHPRYYERKPGPKRAVANETASSPEAKPVAAVKPKPVKAASRKANPPAGVAQADISDRVVAKKSDFRRPRWQRRAERRARKAFGRAFLLGR